ncbi:MAG: YjgP/YjgQ family permease [candidate division Zixibacteria bacterium]|nr:YjgP/YjgQ family permease [candidate division Zixibacteria bacterium]
MSILDRYITKRFLLTLGFALIAFVIIFLVVDLIENLDKFIDRATGSKVVMLYYLNFIPFIVVLTLPVAMLLSTLFSLGMLAKNFELTAMKANGVSLYRILAPLYVISLLISLFVFYVGDDLVSKSNRRKSEIKAKYLDRKASDVKAINSDIFIEGENGAVYYMKQYNPNLTTGKSVLIQRIENNRIIESIEAKKLTYTTSGWKAELGTKRVFNSDTTLAPNTFEEFEELLLTDYKEPPEAFENLKRKPEDMTYGELKKYIALKKRLGKDIARELVELNLKISFPLINFIIIFLGGPLAANPRRSGAALGFATSLIISFIFFTIIRACQSLGQNHQLHPVLAAWLGNIIFGVIGIVFTIKAHK